MNRRLGIDREQGIGTFYDQYIIGVRPPLKRFANPSHIRSLERGLNDALPRVKQRAITVRQ